MKSLQFLIPAFIILASACNSIQEVDEEYAHSLETRVAGKIINQPVGCAQSSFLVKLAAAPSGQSISELSVPGVKSIEKLFTSLPGNEEMEARFGLDRWFIVELEDGADLKSSAEAFAEFSEVTTVEYNMLMTKASDCIVHPAYEPCPETRAGESVFNDPYLSDQWHYINRGNTSIATSIKKGADINVEQVWKELTTGNNDIIIAVVDEGVKYSHPDLQANMWHNVSEIPGNGIDDDNNGYVDDYYGYNFVDNGQISWTLYGDTGHGTHVAGTIAAVNNNSLGVSGVAGGSGKGDGCRIMSCQVFSGQDGGYAYQTARAIKYAADMGASIISCSFGATVSFPSDNAYYKNSAAEIDAVRYFEAAPDYNASPNRRRRNNPINEGGIAIFATGNDGQNFAHYPGAYHDIISVSSFGPDYLPAYYTNYGPGCNITAPGGEAELKPWTHYRALVLSTVPSELSETSATKNESGIDYGYMQGTSMATPHVSGVVALGMSYAKKLGKTYDTQTFKEMVIASANDFESQLNSTSARKDYKTTRTLNLANYRKNMGSGSIDAWLLCMKIEGIPSTVVKYGENQWVDMSPFFGTSATNLTYMTLKDGEYVPVASNEKAVVEVSDSDRDALGLAEDPYVQYGKLFIHPTKVGSGKIRVYAVGGGTDTGGGDKPTGGMQISQEISVVSRSIKSSNGGWL